MTEEIDEAYRDQNGRAIEPCTLEQIDRALGIIKAHWPKNHPGTRETIRQLGMLREDMAENLKCGTDINFNSVSWGAMESYNTFLAIYPNLVQEVRPTEVANIAAEWEGQKGAGHITFMGNGETYCIANYKVPKDTFNFQGTSILSRECKPEEIGAAFREMRAIQQAQIQQALAQQRSRS